MFPMLYLAVHSRAGTLCDFCLFEEKIKKFKLSRVNKYKMLQSTAADFYILCIVEVKLLEKLEYVS